MKNVIYALCFFMGIIGPAYAAEPDFSGNWRLVREIAIENDKQYITTNPDGDLAVLITHTGDSFQVENQCAHNCARSVRAYITDGTLREVPNNVAKVTYTAKCDGDTVIISQKTEAVTPFGPAMTLIKQVWSLSADRQILMVSSCSQRTTGTVAVMQVYERVH